MKIENIVSNELPELIEVAFRRRICYSVVDT